LQLAKASNGHSSWHARRLGINPGTRSHLHAIHGRYCLLVKNDNPHNSAPS